MTTNTKRQGVMIIAAEAGLGSYEADEHGMPKNWHGVDVEALERFYDGAAKTIIMMREIKLAQMEIELLKAIPAAVAAEREACAQLCDARAFIDSDAESAGHAAAAIRARSAT